MRLNDLTLLAIVLLLGIFIGVIGTAAVYGSIASRQADAEQKEAQETVKQLENELQEKQARIDKYLEDEDNKRRALEQPGADEPRSQPAPAVAATPRAEPAPPTKREVVAAPREEGSGTPAPTTPAPAPPSGFRPPKQFDGK
jgi:hypothetical protein